MSGHPLQRIQLLLLAIKPTCVSDPFARRLELVLEVCLSWTYGYSKDVVPLLKIRRDKFDPDAVNAYFLAEVVDERTVRLIGYITPEMVPEVAEEVEEGETYQEDDPDRRFSSRDDNYVVEPDSLQAVWRRE
ncbi:hypothetical protein CV102_17695 [Natronococcus pandeyae]|uniref:Uncharacterized protein n=1 Tax=Natronococcus pandeyae TaxID=2055836 RepID=A0A8J8Q483_9EURY|nr:hypothetical protein CV102_17695 [Natronococcus pandeyae]